MTIKEREEYIKFMHNPKNEGNCAECPENENRAGRLPCGQQNCWVACHCNHND